METRVFRGAIRPPVWAGMPFVFGLCWACLTFLAFMYSIAIFNDSLESLVMALLVIAFISLTIFFLVRGVTAKDPFRLRQIRMRLMLRIEQNNFGSRGYLNYVPYTPKRK